MVDIFQDVDEALRREKIAALWQAHGGLIVGIVIALVLGTGAYSAYKSWSDKRMAEQTENFWVAQESASPDGSSGKTLTLDSSGRLRTLALLTQAGALADKAKIEEARKAYEALAADRGADPLARDFATVMAARMVSETSSVTLDSAQQQLKALDMIIAKKDSPWGAAARLSAATLCAEILKDLPRARTYITPMLDSMDKKQTTEAPTSIVLMARQLDHVWSLGSPAQAAPRKAVP